MSLMVDSKFLQNPTRKYTLSVMVVIALVAIGIGVGLNQRRTNTIPHAQSDISADMKLALRIPTIEVYQAIKPYQDGSKAEISFIFYGRIETMEEIIKAGATQGSNPAELGVLIGCDMQSVGTVRDLLSRYRQANITYLMQDCEKGPDQLWSQPDVPSIAESLKTLVNANPDFRWQVAMQFGYLQNTFATQGGDKSVCTGRELTSCDIATSFAGEVWQNYNTNDIFTIFGQSGSQDTPDGFESVNSPWLNYMHTNYPQNDWWGVTGLTDQDKNGIVDLSPQTVFDIATRAKNMGASAFGVIWAGGRDSTYLFGPATEMDKLLELWMGEGSLPTTTPIVVPSSTPVTTPTGTAANNINNINIKVRFQGVTSEGKTSSIQMEFIQNGVVKFVKTANYISGTGGVYTINITGSESNLVPGVYSLHIKGNSHLARMYSNVSLTSGNLNLDFAQDERYMLKSGDVTRDNKISIDDVARLLQYYTDFSVAVDATNQEMLNCDINKDGSITVSDAALLAINWSDFEVSGE